MKEALRLSYGVTTRLPRVAREDMYYKEHFIPAGVRQRWLHQMVLTK